MLCDTRWKEKLISLPLCLTCKILSSDNLILRHPKTRLLTRPCKREKFILEYILEYSKSDNMEQADSTDVQKLLECIKWSVLNLYSAAGFVLNHFASNFGNGKYEQEIR